MKRKIMTACLAAMMALILTVPAEEAEVKAAEAAEETAEEAVEAVEETAEEAVEAEEETAEETVEAAEETADEAGEGIEIVTVEDGIVVDTEDCRMEITGFEPAGDYGYTIYATCENKTEDKNMRFSIVDGAVNGYMVDPFWSAEVAPGSVSYENIVYDNEELAEAGASDPQEILWELWAYNSDDYGANPYFDKVVAIYPNGKPEEPVEPAERISTESEIVLVDNDDLTFVILGREADDYAYTLKAYIENKKDYPVMVAWDNVSVNDTMVDPFWAVELLPGTRAYSDIDFSNTDLEENNITEVTEISCDMTAYNAEDWLADYLLEDTYTFNP